MTDPGLPPAGWHDDPSGRHRLRYWDGVQWTAYVSDRGETAVDPIPGADARSAGVEESDAHASSATPAEPQPWDATPAASPLGALAYANRAAVTGDILDFDSRSIDDLLDLSNRADDAGVDDRRLVHPLRQPRDPRDGDAGPLAGQRPRDPPRRRRVAPQQGLGRRRLVVGHPPPRHRTVRGGGGEADSRAEFESLRTADPTTVFGSLAAIAAAILLIRVIRTVARRQAALVAGTVAGPA